MEQNEKLNIGVGNEYKKIINCKDCGKILNNFYAKQCKSCCRIGKEASQITKEKIRLAKIGEKNPIWKGDNVKYRALHAWLERNKHHTKNCERCHKKKKLCLANISGNYKRDINDYEWLCYSCHNKKDMIGLNFHKLKNKGRLKNGN
jgi:hypothetical protein